MPNWVLLADPVVMSVAMLPLKHDRPAITFVGCSPRMMSANMISSNRSGYAAAADGDPLRMMAALVLQVDDESILCQFPFIGDWLCLGFVAIHSGFSRPSMTHSNSPRVKTRTVRFSMMLAIFLFDVGEADASNTRSEFLPQRTPLSLLYFDVTDSDESAMQPEKAFDGRGCYVGSEARHSSLLRQLLGLVWVDSEMRLGND